MRHWFRRLRGAFLMGVVWALAWGLGIGGAIELLQNIGLGQEWMRRIDMWPQTLAIPGFISGAVFSIVLGIAGRGRKFEDLSTPRFASWGAAGGLLGGALMIAMWGISGPVGIPLFLGVPALLGSLSAAGTLKVARMAERHTELPAGTADGDARLTDGDRG